MSEYDRTKWVAHYEVAEPMMKAGLPLVIVQPGMVYGPGDASPMRETFVQYLKAKLPVTPQRKAFCWAHVDDVAAGHLLAMAKGKPGESYIIAGPPHTFQEAFAIAEKITIFEPVGFSVLKPFNFKIKEVVMQRSHLFMLLMLAMLVMSANSFAQVTNKKLTGQNFGGEITVNASPQAVWAVLTDVQKLGSALNFEYEGAPQKLENVGDNVQMKVWGDTGTYILIYAKPGSELRYVWEPDNATYICQERWTLAPSGKGTKVTYEERYTESGPQTAEAIAEQVKTYNQALAKVKAMCEGK